MMFRLQFYDEFQMYARCFTILVTVQPTQTDLIDDNMRASSSMVGSRTRIITCICTTHEGDEVTPL